MYGDWNFNSGNYLFTSRSHKGLSPCDFDLIPMMKEPLRGIRFRTVPEILHSFFTPTDPFVLILECVNS